jgi:hypothetical protein
MARPWRGYERFLVKIEPEQAKALRDAALRAKLEGLPNAGDGASLVVRRLVGRWIAEGAKWPGSAAPARRNSKPKR